MIIFNYLLYYLLIIPISLLPFKLLYGFSDFLFIIFYHITGYRKQIVMTNLRNSFPDKSEQEIKLIARRFYAHLCDLFVESFKSFTISQKQINKRMMALNPEAMNKYFDLHRSIILAGGHYNNWEWFAIGINQQMKHRAIAIYTTLSNKFFDRKMRLTRSKFGLLIVSTKIVKDIFEQYKEQLTATIFAVDQSPRNVEKSYWIKFLHQDSAVQFGSEKYAKDYNYPVFYGSIKKVKRGYYTFEAIEITSEPQQQPHGAIIKEINRHLENDIVRAPQFWLWTHRRWKHKKP